MAHLHQHAGQNHINFGSIGQKIVKVAEIGSAMKGIVETGIFLKNTLAPVVGAAAALALWFESKLLQKNINHYI